jgi:hypothetical protein
MQKVCVAKVDGAMIGETVLFVAPNATVCIICCDRERMVHAVPPMKAALTFVSHAAGGAHPAAGALRLGGHPMLMCAEVQGSLMCVLPVS